jgi:hypothetical protein
MHRDYFTGIPEMLSYHLALLENPDPFVKSPDGCEKTASSLLLHLGRVRFPAGHERHDVRMCLYPR